MVNRKTEKELNKGTSDQIKRYFVDESGDGVIFAHHGRILIGQEGCSRFFMLGLLEIADPLSLGIEMKDLRTKLMTDEYFKDVPSMQPNQNKTAVAFHAKDDLPEVRREVFHLLKTTPGLRFFAVVTDKFRVLEYVRERNTREPEYSYNPNELYDYLVRRLFKERLHKDKGYEITFSKRGKSDRTKALNDAILISRDRFLSKWGKTSSANIQVGASLPAQNAGLQAVDYFLWALQRVYTANEDRYISLLSNSIGLIHDIDDHRQAEYGVYYNKKMPLSVEALIGRK